MVSLKTTSPCHLYVKTTKAMQFNENFPALPIANIFELTVFLFEMTSQQDAAERSH